MGSFSVYGHIDAVDGKIKRVTTPHGTRKEVRYKHDFTPRKLMNRTEMKQSGKISTPIEIPDDEFVDLADSDSDEGHGSEGLNRASLKSSTPNTSSVKGQDFTNIYNNITSRSSPPSSSPPNFRSIKSTRYPEVASYERGRQATRVTREANARRSEPHLRHKPKIDRNSTFGRIDRKHKYSEEAHRRVNAYISSDSDNEGLNMNAQNSDDELEIAKGAGPSAARLMMRDKAQKKTQFKPATVESGSDNEGLFVSPGPARKSGSSVQPLMVPSGEHPEMPSCDDLLGSRKRARTEEKTSAREHPAASSQQPAKEPIPSPHTTSNQAVEAQPSPTHIPKMPTTQQDQDHDHVESTADKSSDTLDKNKSSGLSLTAKTTQDALNADTDDSEAAIVKTEHEEHGVTDSPAMRSKKRKRTEIPRDVKAQILEAKREAKRRFDEGVDWTSSDHADALEAFLTGTETAPASKRLTTENDHADALEALLAGTETVPASNRLTTENLEYQTQIQTLTEEVEKANTEIVALTEEAEKASKKAKAAKKDLKRLREENDDLGSDKAALEKEARAAEKQSRDQTQKIANLRSQMKELDDDGRSKDRKIRKLEDEMEKAKITYEHRIEGLEEELKTAQDQAKSIAKEKIANEFSASAREKSSTAALNVKLQQMIAELAQAKQDLAKSEEQKAALAKNLERGNTSQAGGSDGRGDGLAVVKNEVDAPIIKPAMREDYKRLNDKAMKVVAKGLRFANQAEYGTFAVALQNLADEVVTEIVDD